MIKRKRSKGIHWLGVVLLGALLSLGVSAQDFPPPESGRIAVLVGTTSERIAEKMFPQAERLLFDAMGDAVPALQSGKAEYIITAQTNCLNFVKHNDDLAVLPQSLSDETSSIAINKDDKQLYEDITELVEQYKKDGTLAKLEENWIHFDGADYIITDIPEADGEPLEIAIAADREPMCFVMNGEYAGLDIELARRLAYDMGRKPVFRDMKFAAMIPSVTSGKTPMAISNITDTPERRESVNFSPAYFSNPQMLLTRKEIAVQFGAAETGDASSDAQEGFFAGVASSFEKNFLREQRWKLIVNGIGITLLISICAALFGSVMGFGVCMLRRSHIGILSGFARIYIRILQGTPIVVLLMVFYYVIFNKTGLDGVTVAIIAFGLNYGAYTAEMLRTGIDAVDKGQIEAAAAMGFHPRQAFTKIVFPQAAKHFLPVMKGEFISLVKMTSVVGYVAVQDLTKASDIIRSRTYEAFFPLIVTAILYFIIAWGLSSLLSYFEVRMDPKRRKPKLPESATATKEGGQT